MQHSLLKTSLLARYMKIKKDKHKPEHDDWKFLPDLPTKSRESKEL